MGPGAYDPDFKQVKKVAPATDWASSKAQRAPVVQDNKIKSSASKKNLSPGPGTYEVGYADKIGGDTEKD